MLSTEHGQSVFERSRLFFDQLRVLFHPLMHRVHILDLAEQVLIDRLQLISIDLSLLGREHFHDLSDVPVLPRQDPLVQAGRNPGNSGWPPTSVLETQRLFLADMAALRCSGCLL